MLRPPPPSDFADHCPNELVNGFANPQWKPFRKLALLAESARPGRRAPFVVRQSYTLCSAHGHGNRFYEIVVDEVFSKTASEFLTEVV